MLYYRFTGFLSTAELSSTLVRSIFNKFVYFAYSSTGFNFRYGYLHIKAFCITHFNLVILSDLFTAIMVFVPLLNP